MMSDRDMSIASDAQLVIAVSRFDQAALAELYRRHASPLYGLARRLLVDRTLAEEVVQEVFLRLWDRPERYDPERGSLRSFLLAQCHGRAVDLLRSEIARRSREERDADGNRASGPDVELEVLDMTIATQVRAALAVLTPPEKDAIELAYLGGHTYRQVADMLGEPEGTVKSRIRSGLRKMRHQLADVAPSRGGAG